MISSRKRLLTSTDINRLLLARSEVMVPNVLRTDQDVLAMFSLKTAKKKRHRSDPLKLDNFTIENGINKIEG